MLIAPELKELRNMLLPLTSAWNNLLNIWGEKVLTNAPDSVDYFIAEIIPASKAIKDLIENHPFIHNVYKLQPKTQMTVVMGEVPLYKLWEFYEKVGLTTPESFAVLHAAKAEGKFNHRVPFISFEPLNVEEVNQPVIEETAEIKPTKKSLDID